MTALRAIDPWARIAELEGEVDYYKRELGMILDQSRLATVESQFHLTKSQARILLALHAAHPRMMTKAALHQVIYVDREPETEIKIVDVTICKLRKNAGGEDMVETIWGRGYRLTEAGAHRTRVVLERAE